MTIKHIYNIVKILHNTKQMHMYDKHHFLMHLGLNMLNALCLTTDTIIQFTDIGCVLQSVYSF